MITLPLTVPPVIVLPVIVPLIVALVQLIFPFVETEKPPFIVVYPSSLIWSAFNVIFLVIRSKASDVNCISLAEVPLLTNQCILSAVCSMTDILDFISCTSFSFITFSTVKYFV